jgi:ABC-type multidrug transport system fused ATPase/permease subunit
MSKIYKEFAQSLNYFEKRNRFVIIFFLITQMMLSILDLIGVALFGLVASIGFGNSKLTTNKQVVKFLEVVNLERIELSSQIFFLSGLVLTFFAAKSFLSLYISKKFFAFLARRQTELATETIKKVSSAPYFWIKNQNPHQLSHTINHGVTALITNGIGQSLLLFSELSLLLTFLLLLALMNPIVALFIIIYLSLIIYIVNISVSRKVSEHGRRIARIIVRNQEIQFLSLKLFREIRILERRQWFEKRVNENQGETAQTEADNIWIQQLPKHIMEVAMMLGIFFVVSISLLADSSSFGLIALYLAGASRIFPSILRSQSAILSLRLHSGLADETRNLISELDLLDSKQFFPESQDAFSQKFLSDGEITLQFNDVWFQFNDANTPVLRNVDVVITGKEFIAVSGPSGAGKSTFSELALGFLTPTSGDVTVNSVPVTNWITNNPGQFSYMPQDSNLINGTIMQNICLGIEDSDIDLRRLDEVLEIAQLKEFISSLPSGVNTEVGQIGNRLSGGQKQRIAIARSIYSNPKFLILDEPTSALDSATEEEFLRMIERIQLNCTVIIIAHKLSTLINANRILYFKDGEIVCDGSFAEIRKVSKSLDKQAKILGL